MHRNWVTKNKDLQHNAASTETGNELLLQTERQCYE